MNKIIAHFFSSRPGYILPLTFSIISGIVLIMSYLFIRGNFFIQYGTHTYRRERATILVHAGIEIARAILAQAPDEKKKSATVNDSGDEQQKPVAEDRLKKLLNLFVLKRGVGFLYEFSPNVEGFLGKFRIDIQPEEGKLDLNALYNFQTHKFIVVQDPEKSRQLVQKIFEQIEKIVGGKDLFSSLENFLKKKKIPLADLSELLLIDEWRKVMSVDRSPQYQQKIDFAVEDIFTLATKKKTINPWFLSPAWQQILAGTRIVLSEPVNQEAAEFIAQIKQPCRELKNWEEIYKKIYGKNIDPAMQSLTTLFDAKDLPVHFSIFVESIVGTTVVRAHSILHCVPWEDGRYKALYKVLIKKIVWI